MLYYMKSLCNSSNKHDGEQKLSVLLQTIAGSMKLAERWKLKIKIKYNRLLLVCTYVYVYTHLPVIARFVNHTSVVRSYLCNC